MPTSSFAEAGERIEFTVSELVAAMANWPRPPQRGRRWSRPACVRS
jgi:hypothetical protein